MEGLNNLAVKMGIELECDVMYTHAPVPGDEYLTFSKDANGEEYGFRTSLHDSDILECFYFRSEGIGRTVISETRIVTDDSAGIPLLGKRAAIIYRRAKGKSPNTLLFLGLEFQKGFLHNPDLPSCFGGEPIVFVKGLIVARKFKKSLDSYD